jgi:hypothetical protein
LCLIHFQDTRYFLLNKKLTLTSHLFSAQEIISRFSNFDSTSSTRQMTTRLKYYKHLRNAFQVIITQLQVYLLFQRRNLLIFISNSSDLIAHVHNLISLPFRGKHLWNHLLVNWLLLDQIFHLELLNLIHLWREFL